MTMAPKYPGRSIKQSILFLIVATSLVNEAKAISGPEVCKLPKVVGPCRAALPRFFFNSATGKCEPFVYGGCQGNDNNFLSLAACQADCVKKTVTGAGPGPEVCKLPKVVGPCRAALPRFFFNSATGKCEQFVYGGCQGNGNNFLSLAACQADCVKKTGTGAPGAKKDLKRLIRITKRLRLVKLPASTEKISSLRIPGREKRRKVYRIPSSAVSDKLLEIPGSVDRYRIILVPSVAKELEKLEVPGSDEKAQLLRIEGSENRLKIWKLVKTGRKAKKSKKSAEE